MKPAPRILVVGQVPPPYGGQAVMIQSLLDAPTTAIEMFHVPMRFSLGMNEMGRFRSRKLTELFNVIFAIYKGRIKHRTKILYYPPAGPSFLPVIRDFVILLSTRWMFKKTAFHFLASGLNSYLATLSRPLQWIARITYGSADLAILQGESAPREGKLLGARREIVIPCGVVDLAKEPVFHPRPPGLPLQILFIAMLSEDKGVLIAVRSLLTLLDRGYNLRFVCVGPWAAPELKTQVEALLETSPWKDRFEFPGVVIGEAKAALYRQSHIFCFPSFFHSETSGLVLMEAMSFCLPVVATRWRAIPDVVAEGETGLLVPIRDVEACSEALGKLLDSEDLCIRMGVRGRQRFLENFTLSVYQSRMVESLASLDAGAGRP